MRPITFHFYVETADGHEQDWLVEADITLENGRYFADITGASLTGGTDYDASDLEEAVIADGRTFAEVKQAAIDAYVAQFAEAI